MEKLREAIRNLEKQAEHYERHLGAERFEHPGEDFFAMLSSDVDDITAELCIPEGKKASKPVEKRAEQKPADKK